MYREKGNHIITCVTEHKAVIDTCKQLEKQGFRVTYLPVQKDGRISLDELRAAITDKTILITIMTANNEIGVLQPIAEIGAIAKEKGDPVPHRRRAGGRQGSVQRQRAEGRPGVDQRAQDVRPEGRRRALRAPPQSARAAVAEQIDGGGHERGMRSGTLNVPGIVGFGKAAELCRLEMATDTERLIGAARSPEQAAARRPRRDLHQRLDGAPAAAQPEHQLRLRRRRVAADGHQRRRGVVGLGLHLGQPRAVLRAEGARRRRRPGALLDPLRPRPVDDRGRSRLRRRQADRRSCTRLREMSPLYEMAKEGVDLSTMQWEVH